MLSAGGNLWSNRCEWQFTVGMCLVLWIPLIKFKQDLPILSSVIWSFFFSLLTSVSILITIRRELEKLKKDLEEEKLLRNSLEVMLSLWEGMGSSGVWRLCSGFDVTGKSYQTCSVSFCVAVLFCDWMKASWGIWMYREDPSSVFFFWNIICNNQCGGWGGSSV